MGWVLLALAVIDWHHLLLPNKLTYPLILAGIVSYALLTPENLMFSIIGTFTGFASLYLVAILYKAIRKQEGLGLGDAKLFAAMGAWIGAALLPVVLLISSLLGLIGTGILAASGKQTNGKTALPFGTYLCAGFWLMLLFEHEIMTALYKLS